MNKMIMAAVLGLALIGTAVSARAESAPESPGMPAKGGASGGEVPGETARIGAPAPSFSLDAVVEKEFKKIGLADYQGKWVVLFFYPNDFSFVCPTEIKGFNGALESFRKLNAEILGVSVDSKFAHLAWIKRGDLGDLKFPLLSDATKEVSGKYGVLDRTEGTALRGLFIIDPQGALQYVVIHNRDVGRSVEETLRVLEALQTGSLCPLGWKPGKKTIAK